MKQQPLFCEDWIEALKVDIAALGGAQVVGIALWPKKMDPAKAGEHLRNCLNPDRREKFDQEHVLWIKAEARKIGSFATQTYENELCGFAPPVPIEPKDEAAALMREFTQGVKTLESLAQRIERVDLPGMVDNS